MGDPIQRLAGRQDAVREGANASVMARKPGEVVKRKPVPGRFWRGREVGKILQLAARFA
jgi:hypothetical protein